MKKILISFCVVLAVVSVLFLSGCDKNKTGKVYYLNFKPEVDDKWKSVAEAYKEETGVDVQVVTAASGKYEETLTAQMNKSDAPTLFQISGLVGYETWKDYCYDMSESDFYKELTSDDFAIKKDGGVYGVAYVYEGYGIIVNKALLSKAGYSMNDIKDFAGLKKVAEDITSKKDQLGFSAFTSSTLDGASSWRFSGHLANVALSYDFVNITEQPATITFSKDQNFKNMWDLYINNATVAKTTLATAVNGQEEFANKKAVFYQNGTWAYADCVKNGIKDSELGYIPCYMGIDDSKQALACGTENYWAVNKLASKADIQATLDFLYWVVTSEKGTKALADDMGFVSPFKKAKPVSNVLCNLMNEYTAAGKVNTAWTAMNMTPNTEEWRKDVVNALLQYSANNGSWDNVKKAFVDGWKKQYDASHK